MTSLIEKFRNVRFPNWMREIKAANDNIPPVSRNIYHTYNNFLLYERRSFSSVVRMESLVKRDANCLMR